MMSARRIRHCAGLLLRETVREWHKDKVSNLAAALAYYTIFSIAPFLIFVIAIAGFFLEQSMVQSEIIAQIQQVLGEDSAILVQNILENTQNGDVNSGFTASMVSIGLIFLGATGVFAQLQSALNTIWNIKPPKSQGLFAFFRIRLLSFVMIVGIGFLLFASLVLSAVLAAIHQFAQAQYPIFEQLSWQVISTICSAGIRTFLFAMIFKFLPDARIYWRDVWVGAVMTMMLFSLGEVLLELYLRHSGFSSSYGAAGSLVVVIAWVYYSAQSLLMGAEFTQVYARNFGIRIQSKRAEAK